MVTAEELKNIRKLAEDSVADMPEGELKVKAFEVILEHLLASGGSPSITEDPKKKLKPKTNRKNSNQNHPTETKIVRSLPDHIMDLRDNKKFFGEPRTADEVHQELMSSNYHCERDRVYMALLRIAKRKELRKASKTINEKPLMAYVW